MTDALGWRSKFAVLAPSTNTIVEADFSRMAVPGVTSHFARIHLRNIHQETDDAFQSILNEIRHETGAALERVMTCEPDYVVMAVSALSFWGGERGHRSFKQEIEELSGLRVATGAESVDSALKLIGARRIAIVTPYQPVGDQQVAQFFIDQGYDVVGVRGLRCPTAVSIAHVQESDLRLVLQELDSARVDAFVQVGTNLSMVRLADEAERWLGKPVIAVNAAIWWKALRDNEIHDRILGAGQLLREH